MRQLLARPSRAAWASFPQDSAASDPGNGICLDVTWVGSIPLVAGLTRIIGEGVGTMLRSKSQVSTRTARIIVVVALVALSLSVPGSPAAAASAGTFKVSCEFSHRAMADPIVSPGARSEHLHDFFGNETTDRDSTYGSMVGQPTSCGIDTDSAAFWAPTMLDQNENPIPIDVATVYYRDWPDSGHEVTVYPKDFRIVSGFPNLQQAKGIGGSAVGGNWGFQCDNDEPLQPTSAIDCTGHSQTDVMAVVFFPQCGERNGHGGIMKDSSDHRSHAAFATGESGGCPRHHPIKLPLAYIKIKYAVTDCIAAQCHLSSDGMSINGKTCSDPGCTLHADFWNTWDQGPPSTPKTLKNLVKTCLNAMPEKECDL
jgi:hypothetical protein